MRGTQVVTSAVKGQTISVRNVCGSLQSAKTLTNDHLCQNCWIAAGSSVSLASLEDRNISHNIV